MKLKNKLELGSTLKVGALPTASTSNYSVLFEIGGLVSKRTVGNIINYNSSDFISGISNSFPSIFNYNTSTTPSDANLVVSLKNQLAGTVFAAPTTLNGTPSFRKLTDSDLSETSIFSQLGNFVPYTGATSNVNLGTRSITSTGGFIGNASTATTLATARTINGTSFNGSANITTANWGTARNITIGNTTKAVNGSANVSWSLAEIGIPTALDFITTNTTQTGLSGNKTTSGGSWTWNEGQHRMFLSGGVGTSALTFDTSHYGNSDRFHWIAKTGSASGRVTVASLDHRGYLTANQFRKE